MPFIAIASYRPVNKNVSTGAVIRAKPGTEPGVHRDIDYNWRTIKPVHGYKFRPTIGWNGRIGLRTFLYELT